ncbi:MAG: thioesterase family protein [Polyangia bacterium]
MIVATVRPLYADTDQMGIVNHAVALRWFELARAEWLRRLGHSYRQMEADGVMLPVYELGVRYFKPAYYDQLLDLDARLELPGHVRIVFHYRITDKASGELLISGTTKHASIEAGGIRSGRPRRLPDELRTLLETAMARDAEHEQGSS